MRKTLKWLGIGAFFLFFAGALTSCASSRRLGCPMKITHVMQKHSHIYFNSYADYPQV